MRRRDVLVSAGLGAAALAAPAIRSARAQAGKTLVFGGSVPLTGAAAETGLNVNNGYITAASYLNDVLGGVEIAGEKYKIELKLFDDASDPARATTLIQRQLDDGTDFFLGSFGSNIVLPTAAITLALMPTRSSRVMPGLRGTPAVTITTSAPAMSL